jgi:hypothetical protein
MEKTSYRSAQEFFDLWSENSKATFGKLFDIPTVGPMREKSEKMMKGFPIFSNLYASWMDSNAKLQSVFMEAMHETYENAATEMKGEIGPEKYRDFYKIWMETYSKTFKEFLNSDGFTSDWGKFMSNYLDFQEYNREMLEENYLKPMNIPTKTEIDEIIKEVYSLKKKVRELTSQINELTENK